MTDNEIRRRCRTLHPGMDEESYLQGYLDSISDQKRQQYGQDMFFTELATKMRLLWPPGDKVVKDYDGVKTYPWRTSVVDLAKRLKFIWREKGLEDKYSIDECLTVARRYVAQFENKDKKYMRILQYYVYKKKSLVSKLDGKRTEIYTSDFVDSLLSTNMESVHDEIESENTVDMFEIR